MQSFFVRCLRDVCISNGCCLDNVVSSSFCQIQRCRDVGLSGSENNSDVVVAPFVMSVASNFLYPDFLSL